MKKWEYRVEETKLGISQARMDYLGSQRWELVSELMVNNQVRAVFKRPVSA